MVKGENISICSIVSILLFVSLVLTGCVTLTSAYVPDAFLIDGWYENTSLRNTGLQFMGMEKWGSLTYEINGKFPATLTVTTLKSLIIANEEDIKKKTTEAIDQTFNDRIIVTNSTSGKRQLSTGHESIYMLYEGYDTKDNETVKMIGEVWNCPTSGTSIICIGLAFISNHEQGGLFNMSHWNILIQDPLGTLEGSTGEKGLIYNIVCH